MTRNESEAKRLMSSAAGKAAVASEIKDLRSHSTVYQKIARALNFDEV